MKLKKWHALVICLILLTFPQSAAAALSSPSQIYVNNQKLSSYITSADSDGITYVAASEFAQYLGGAFAFNADSLSGVLNVGGHELVFYLDGNVAAFDGKNVLAPAPMRIINNRLMIPAAFAADKLGAANYINIYQNALMIFNPGDGRLVYSVLPGDTLWKISQVFSVTIDSIRQNNGISGDMIYVGQNFYIKQLPAYNSSITASTVSGTTVFSAPGFDQPVKGYLGTGASLMIKGKSGSWYKVDTKVGSGYVYRTVVGISQEVAPAPRSTYFDNEIPVDTSGDIVTYSDYTVVRGDSVWAISQKYGIPDYELAAANNISATATLYPGQMLKIPVHNIARQAVTDPRFGEVLDWFKQAQYVFPAGKTGRLIDPVTGAGFMVKRTMGTNHSDTEPLTAADTQTMKSLFGGSWSWTRKAFILEVDGRRFAVSVSGMPHAGVDGVPLYQNVDNRSGNYGYGPNFDAIAGNGMDGHFDLYFLNSRTHYDNSIDPQHQYMVLAAGGLR